MRFGVMIATLIVLSAAGLARADSAPLEPTDYHVEQDGPDVRIQVSICNECIPWHFDEVRRVGDEVVVVDDIGYGDGEIVDSWSWDWENWRRVEIVDHCVPVVGESTEYTYDFVRVGSVQDDIYESLPIRVSDAGPCDDGPTVGCGASVSGSRTVAVMPWLLGLLLVLVGAVTLRASPR
jgi:hypothetical protein